MTTRGMAPRTTAAEPATAPERDVRPGRRTETFEREPAYAPASDDWIGAPSGPSADPAADVRPYLRLLKRYRGLIAAVFAVCIGTTGVRYFLQEPIYMAKASILPSGGQGSSGVLGLIASMTGAPPILGGSEESSSMLFPRIVESRRVGLEVTGTRFKIASRGGAEMSLQEYLEAENDDEALRALKSIRAVDVDKETGMIAITVSTPDPELSAQVANRCVEVLEKVNGEIRRASAAQNSEFLQERLAEMQAELRAAEDRLTHFRQQNMRMSAPELEADRLRLEREAAMKSQIFVSLSSQAELARLEEAKNLPIVRVLERAAVPTLPVPVSRLALLVGACFAALVLSVVLVAAIEIGKFLRAAAWTI